MKNENLKGLQVTKGDKKNEWENEGNGKKEDNLEKEGNMQRQKRKKFYDGRNEKERGNIVGRVGIEQERESGREN